jgi:RNA polymerase sigma-70 factor (ECF subfamily)
MSTFHLPIVDGPPAIGTQSRAIDSPPSLTALVRRVEQGDGGGMVELYELLLLAFRPYLIRQLRHQDYNDKLHNIFVDVVVAIQSGQLRDPERLMGYARTIARRKVSAYIDAAASTRRNHVEIGSFFALASPGATPEQAMVTQQQKDLLLSTLSRLARRESEILSRFYLQEQPEIQIRSEMDLTHTQYRLLKSRSKSHFGQLSRKQIAAWRTQPLARASRSGR